MAHLPVIQIVVLTLFTVSASLASDNVTCPSSCVCLKVVPKDDPSAPLNAVWVNCRQDRYKVIPSAAELPDNIYGLDLSLNQIKTLDVSDTIETLRMLRLDGNRLAVLEPASFEHLPNLTSLDLSYNNITALPNAVFDNLLGLKVLKLTSNYIEHLSEDTFKYNIWLTELYLNDNPLRIIYPEWFRSTNSLVKLNLAATQMYALPLQAFHYTHSLQELDLSDNQFSKVPTAGLRSATKLRKLILDNNPIQVLDENSFTQLNTLEELQICRMHKLVDVLGLTFTDQVNLKKLTMAMNPELFYVDKFAFYGSFNSTWLKWEEIDLKGNRIASLNQKSLPWCKLKSVDLQQNPLRCDCELGWVPSCESTVKGPRCSSPSEFQGLEIHRIEAHDFKCRPNYQSESQRLFRFFVIIFGTIIFVFLGIAIAMVLKRNAIVRWWTERKRGTGSIYYVKANSIPGDSQVEF